MVAIRRCHPGQVGLLRPPDGLVSAYRRLFSEVDITEEDADQPVALPPPPFVINRPSFDYI